MNEDDNEMSWRVTSAVLGLLLVIFGGYLVYEKVGLALIEGVTEERAGLTYRDAESISFWMSVSMFAIIGVGIVTFGLAVLWQIFRPDRNDDDQ